MADVTLEIAAPGQRVALENLFQLYTHDFSDFWFDRSDGELRDDGRFDQYVALDDYWAKADHIPVLMRAGGSLAGFVLINAFAHSGLPVDFSIAEFFVVRKHRRAGVGLAAATAIIRARPGQWEAAVARRNTTALRFWRRVAATVAGSGLDETDHDDDIWNGGVIRFVVEAATRC